MKKFSFLTALLLMFLSVGAFAQDANVAVQASKFNKPKGYFGLVEMTLPTYLLNPGLPVGVSMVNGYRVCPEFAVGFGLGIKSDIRNQEFFIPAYVHLRSDFFNERVSPYVSFDVGYNFSRYDGLYHGIIMNPEVGVSYNVGKYRMTTGFEMGNILSFGIEEWVYECNLKVGFSF